MKKVLVSIVVFFILLVLAAGFTSCTKTAPTPSLQSTKVKNASLSITQVPVEYKITNETANITVRYAEPDANGDMVIVEKIVLRTVESFNIVCKSGSLASIQAWNTEGERKEITVEIFVNGEIFTSGSLNHLSGIAEASGLVY